jgi:hypothetical protein
MNLYQTAYTLAEEIRDGMWNQVKEITQKPAPACDEIISELERRCPGHKKRNLSNRISKSTPRLTVTMEG